MSTAAMGPETPRRIALCGVPGSGKTALAKEISTRLKIPLIYQGTKELRNTVGDVKSLPPFWRMNEIQRTLYQLNLIQYRLEVESQYDEFVADGCAVDLLTWYRMCSWLVPFDQKNATIAALSQSAARYTHIFYLPYYEPPDQVPGEEYEQHAVDPINLLTADFITKGVVSWMAHSGRKVYVIQTPPSVTMAPGQQQQFPKSFDAKKAALELRVSEVLEALNEQGAKATVN